MVLATILQHRAAGLWLITLAEHGGIPADEKIADTEWLELAGRND